jgi:glycyl-tRNA synthetase beta subunit
MTAAGKKGTSVAHATTSAKHSKAASTAKQDRRIELLFEIGAEEIPAGMLPRAIAELKTILDKHLVSENLSEGVTVEIFGGPRRLTAWVRGLIVKQADVDVEVTGPPKSVAYDPAGANRQRRIHCGEDHQARAHLARTAL